MCFSGAEEQLGSSLYQIDGLAVFTIPNRSCAWPRWRGQHGTVHKGTVLRHLALIRYRRAKSHASRSVGGCLPRTAISRSFRQNRLGWATRSVTKICVELSVKAKIMRKRCGRVRVENAGMPSNRQICSWNHACIAHMRLAQWRDAAGVVRSLGQRVRTDGNQPDNLQLPRAFRAFVAGVATEIYCFRENPSGALNSSTFRPGIQVASSVPSAGRPVQQ